MGKIHIFQVIAVLLLIANSGFMVGVVNGYQSDSPVDREVNYNGTHLTVFGNVSNVSEDTTVGSKHSNLVSLFADRLKTSITDFGFEFYTKSVSIGADIGHDAKWLPQPVVFWPTILSSYLIAIGVLLISISQVKMI